MFLLKLILQLLFHIGLELQTFFSFFVQVYAVDSAKRFLDTAKFMPITYFLCIFP